MPPHGFNGLKGKRRAWGLLGVAVLGLIYFGQTSYEIPVLMYHHIADSPQSADSLYVTPETFEKQMEFLKVHRYRVLPLGEIVERLKKGEGLPPKAVAVTFDDGHLDNFENAFPVLQKMNFPAALFVITENIGKEGWLSEEDLRILDQAGVSVGSHTVRHAYLADLEEENIRWELVESKKTLEKILGHPVLLLSYPAGGFHERIKTGVRQAGYAGAVTTNRGVTRHDPYALHRIKITEGRGRLFNFWLKLSGFYHLGKRRVETA